jgi:hypothetical protein
MLQSDQDLKRVPKACVECKKKHCKCGEIRPCQRCQQLGLECIDYNPLKKEKKMENQLIFVHINENEITDNKKRKKGEDREIQEVMEETDQKYNFKLDIGIDSPFYTTGRFISTNLPKISYCSPTLRVSHMHGTHRLEKVGVFSGRNGPSVSTGYH